MNARTAWFMQPMKENVHEWADTVMQGFKKRLRESGRLVEF